MCGINGLLYKSATNEVEARIGEMNKLIVHRGPDDNGVYVYEDRLAMGMQRLSIIDLANGHQPMYNKEKTVVIVFNGEIYNFKELRAQLETMYAFNTSSDTEVIIALYEQYGTECFSFLNGMFAIAIHDVNRRQVILARDRFGEKPLYYFEEGECIGWASELKSLVTVLPFKKEISRDGLKLFLNLTYIPAPFTIYEKVFKLEAGCYKIIDTNTLSSSNHCYWDIDISQKQRINDYQTAKQQLRQLLFDSVEKRMIADVPLGVFLSGGIDSTIVAAIMARTSDQPVQTFSIGFSNKRYDESERAQQVAKHIGSDHHQYILDYKEVFDSIDRIILNYDEPFADSSCIPTWFVSQKTSTEVKVALTGDGGDEVFGGYNKYLLQFYGNAYKRFVPKQVHDKLLLPLVQSKYWPAGDSRSLIAKLKKMIHASGGGASENHLKVLGLGFSEAEVGELLSEPVTLKPLFERYLPLETNADILKVARYIDQHVSLEGDMLVKVDRASMLCSLECRAPFLDHRLMEFANQLPDSFLINGSNKKRILKDTFEDLLPAGFMHAPKLGFEVPVSDWFRNELKPALLDTLSTQKLKVHGLFNFDVIEDLIQRHQSGRAENSFKLWTIYCFQKWYEQAF